MALAFIFNSSSLNTPSAKFLHSRASFWVYATRKLCTNFMSIASRIQQVAAASAVAFVVTVVVVVEFWFSYAWIWNPTMQSELLLMMLYGKWIYRQIE